jgi:hypothetical protein
MGAGAGAYGEAEQASHRLPLRQRRKDETDGDHATLAVSP